MTSLLAHTVAQPTKWRFLPKNLNQLVIFQFLWLDLRSLDHELTKIGPNFRKQTTYFKKWSYQKIVFTKVGLLNWYSRMKIFFRKIRIIFDIEKWLWKSEFCNLAGLMTLTKNVQKNFQSHFCDQWSISFSLKSFYQIPLT